MGQIKTAYLNGSLKVGANSGSGSDCPTGVQVQCKRLNMWMEQNVRVDALRQTDEWEGLDCEI